MEEYSAQEEIPSEQRLSRRSFLRGEFLMDWLNRRRTTEQNPNTSKEGSGPGELLVETPADIAVEGTAMFGGELKRRRHEAKLRRQLIGLKMGAPDLETERREVSQKQAAFGQELSDQGNELGDAELEQMEQDHKRIDALLKRRYQANKEAELKQFANTSPEAKPDEIFDTAREAAEQDIPIENMYERRHERKDESDDVTATTEVVNYEPAGSGQLYSVPQSYTSSSQVSVDDIIRTPQPVAPQKSAPSVYKQAVMAGFWSAIILVGIGVFFVIITK